MPLKKKPVNGMKDILPAEMQLRDYLIRLIKESYKSYGFTAIDTPAIEHIENLCSKQGGENEKLIFKILKRGEKLKLETAGSEEELVDGGLRYDLTVPLVRFYSNNQSVLPNPFKALQIGYVWRADRPQRGRYRQFMQCDIDIFGNETNMAEIELILATGTTISKIGFKNFRIRISDRRILRAMAAYSGFSEDEYENVFIILDKIDKIGIEGILAELKNNEYEQEKIDQFINLISSFEKTPDPAIESDIARNNLDLLARTLKGCLDESIMQNMTDILNSVEGAKSGEYEIIFDPTLVRGMSYYTGTIFEIDIRELGLSCGGGGRYDNLVGNFTGRDVPAVGFSIGFERIILLLLENGFKIPDEIQKKAYLIEKGMPIETINDILKKAQSERDTGSQILVTRMNKNKKFQKEQLSSDGYDEIIEIYNNES